MAIPFLSNTEFQDNVQLTFGNSQDLRIYHTGSASYIADVGTGDLLISGTNLRLNDSATGESFFRGTSNGAVQLYYDGAEKFKTTNTGIDVTGTTNLDNLTINGAQGSDGQVLTSTGSGIAWEDASGTSLSGGEASKVAVWSATDTLTHHDNFHFDTTNVRLGIGDSSPNRTLVVSETRTGSTASDAYTAIVKSVQSSGASPNPGTGGLKVQYTSSSSNVHAFGLVAGSSSSDFLTTGPMHFYTNSDLDTVSATGFAMALDTSQRLGIGLTNPSQKLTVSGNVMAGRYYGNTSTAFYLDPNDGNTSAILAGGLEIGHGGNGEYRIEIGEGRTGNGYAYIDLVGDTTYSDYGLRLIRNNTGANTSSQLIHRGTGTLNFKNQQAAHMTFDTSNTERMRIESGGDVGIGTNNPTEKLHVSGGKLLVSDNLYTEMAVDQTDSGKVRIGLSSGTAEGFFMVRNDGSNHVSSAPEFKILLNDSEKLRLDDTGLGIGTNNPQHELHVMGTGEASDDFRAQLFYDSNNTSYYVNPNSTTTSISLAGRITGNSQQVRVKYSVWSGDQYGIGMKSGFTYGHLGDYAMSFQMNDDSDRGWWWGDTGHSDAQGAMSLTTAGRLTVATSLSIGQGGGITSPSTQPLFVDGTAVFDTTSGTEPVCITRSGSTSSEALKIGVTDTVAQFNYIEDTSSEGTGNFGRYDFILGGNSSETSVTPLKLEKTKTTSNAGAFTFGTPGNGTNTLGRWLSFEGNTDSSGEGSGRLFFSEHNSSTTDMDDYGMSIGYRGGSTSVTTAGGNTWTGLTAISNGEWGMWGHDNSLAGNIIMSGPRNGSYVRIHSSSGVRSKIYYDYDNTDFYFQPESTSGTSWRLQTSTGYVKIGSRNSSYVHFYTDRGQYYFDKGLTVDTGAIRSYNEDLNLNRAGSTTARIRVTSGVTHSDQYLQASGSLRAPVFYDSANTSYYADPASTSVFDRIVTGITSTSNGGTALRVEDTMGSATTRLAEFKYNQPSPTVYGGKGTRFYNVAYGGGAVEFYRSSQYGPDSTAVAFVTGSSTVGSISHSGSSTSYNTTSDYRLKENIIDLTGGIEKVKQLQPRRFNFIEDPDNTVDGFIAHEAELIVPESVTGEKDGVYPNGEPVYQAMDSAKLVPVLTAALQEAITKIEDLETRVQSLENQ